MSAVAAGTARVHVVAPPHTEDFGLGDVLPRDEYLERLRMHLEAAEAVGAEAALVYDFPTSLDPWVAAADVLALSATVSPIVAVKPSHEHPLAIVRRVAALAYRFGRRVHLNAVVGASRSDRRAYGAAQDPVPGRRELAEMVHVLRAAGEGPVAFEGEYYAVEAPGSPLPPQLRPRIFTPGSSTAAAVVVPADARLLLAKPLEAIADEVERERSGGESAVAMVIGVIARGSTGEAWEAAHSAHPVDRRRQVAAKLHEADNVSSQHARNFEHARQGDLNDELLWYGAGSAAVDAPKLVGGYDDVAGALRRYVDVGVTELIVDLPHDPAEYGHIARAVAPLASDVPR